MKYPYKHWFNIAVQTRRYSRDFGRAYFDGVERAAALAAVEADNQLKAFGETFDRYLDRCPRWDGSIA